MLNTQGRERERESVCVCIAISRLALVHSNVFSLLFLFLEQVEEIESDTRYNHLPNEPIFFTCISSFFYEVAF